MRSFLRTACATMAVLTPLLGFSNQAQAQQSQFKMAFVNMAILLDNAPGRTQAESTYARETRSYSDQLKRMNDSLNTLFTSYQKAEPTLTAAQKETRQKAMRDLQGALQEKQQQLSQQAQQRQNELMAPIMEQVKKVLDDIRTEDGYSMIRRIRSLPPEQGGRTPAAALTAFARAEDRTAALLAGYQIHLAKPVNPAELIAAVANLAGRSIQPSHQNA